MGGGELLEDEAETQPAARATLILQTAMSHRIAWPPSY